MHHLQGSFTAHAYSVLHTGSQIDLEDIASALGLNFDELIKEMEAIVFSGTKLNIDYYINKILDEEQQQEIMDYCNEKLKRLEMYDNANGSFLIDTLLNYYMCGFYVGRGLCRRRSSADAAEVTFQTRKLTMEKVAGNIGGKSK